MKKNILFILSIFVLSISFVACGSDDDDNKGGGDIEKKLVGKWQMTQAIVDGVKENPSDRSSVYQSCDYQGWTNYKADGTAESYDHCDKTTDKGTWKIKDGKLIVTGAAFPIEFGVQIKELTDTKLVVYFDFVQKQEITYKRID